MNAEEASIPLNDLTVLHGPLRRELLETIAEVVDSGSFAGGPYVAAFEKEFSAYCGTGHCAGVGSGTDALWLALAALGIGPGDEVITVPTTFIATVEAISRTGARPVFVDIDEATYTMDARQLARVTSSRTKAIVPVHLFGRMADMEAILAFASPRGIHVVEDAAQSHGASSRGRRAGSFGVAGCFSFYPGKNLGALGDAGAVTTDDWNLARRIMMLRDHGQHRRNVHRIIGWNCRMDGIQAAVLRLKLRGLDENNERRRRIVRKYTEALAGIPNLVLPAPAGDGEHVHHLYVIQVPHRAKFMDHLQRQGVSCAVHYPLPVHLQVAYAHLGYRVGAFPVAEACARRFVSLPMHADLDSLQIDKVIRAVIAAASADLAA